MILLFLPMIGIIAMIAILSGDENISTPTPTSSQSFSSMATPLPIILPTPTLGTPTPSPSPTPRVLNEPASDLPLTDLGTKDIFRLSDFHGQRIILNFWATWCEPCREEMPFLQTFSDAQGAAGYRVITVTDPTNGQTLEIIEDFVTQLKLTTLTVALDEQYALHHAFNVGSFGLPLTFFIDEDGITRGRFIGQLSPEILQNELDYHFPNAD
jgi:thiol-disulfide isomerase/thioredoxin